MKSSHNNRAFKLLRFREFGVNDIITTGAQPLFFLDYFGTGKLSAETGAAVVKGVADGCRLAGCALLGGVLAVVASFVSRGGCSASCEGSTIANGKQLYPPG